MRKKILHALTILFILGASAFTLTGSALPPETKESITSVTTNSSTGNSSIEDPGVLEQFGPPGVLVSTIIGGVLLIVRNINDGKRIDVSAYKTRADEAEDRANIEIGKAQKRVEDSEEKLLSSIASRDALRTTLEQKKAQFSQQLLDAERRHQEEILSTHASLTTQLAVRYELEKLLIKNGVHFRIEQDTVIELESP